MKQRIAFIINPFSGSVKKRNIPEAIERYLDTTKFEYEIRYTGYSGHAVEISRELSNQNIDIICAVGGDGSIHEIGNGITNHNIVMAVLPIGSGNGIATHMGYIPRDLEDAFEIINTGRVQKIDAGDINGKKFFSVFGVGIDGNVAYQYKNRTRRNLFSYALLVTKQLISALKFYDIEFNIEGKWRVESILTICGFNSNQFGYNVGMIPWASATDGMMEVGVLKKFNALKLPWIAFCLLIKRPKWIRELEIISCTEMKIKKNEAVKFQMDGDPFDFTQDLEVVMHKGYLNFMVRK